MNANEWLLIYNDLNAQRYSWMTRLLIPTFALFAATAANDFYKNGRFTKKSLVVFRRDFKQVNGAFA